MFPESRHLKVVVFHGTHVIGHVNRELEAETKDRYGAKIGRPLGCEKMIPAVPVAYFDG
jgi:hypothetical protein